MVRSQTTTPVGGRDSSSSKKGEKLSLGREGEKRTDGGGAHNQDHQTCSIRRKPGGKKILPKARGKLTFPLRKKKR